MGWVAALLVGLLAWLLVRDVRRRETGLAIINARRDSRPATYWAIIAFWSVCLLFSGLMVLWAYLQSFCVDDPCVVTIQAPPQ